MKAPLRPKTWNFFCRSRLSLPSCVASRPIHSGARMESMAILTAGMAVKPNDSPHPTTPVSVVIETINESAVCRPALPHTPASDRPPAVKGIRNGMDSILAIFMVIAFPLADAVGADRRGDPSIRGPVDRCLLLG